MLQCLLVLHGVILTSTTKSFYEILSYVNFLEVNIVDEWMFEIKFRSWIYRLCSKIFCSFNIMKLLINACMQAYTSSISYMIPLMIRQFMGEERGRPLIGRAAPILFKLSNALTELTHHFNNRVHPLVEFCLGIDHALTELGLGISIGFHFLDYIIYIYVLLHLLIPYSTTTSYICYI